LLGPFSLAGQIVTVSNFPKCGVGGIFLSTHRDGGIWDGTKQKLGELGQESLPMEFDCLVGSHTDLDFEADH
jgi:hypothetical protein